MHRTSGQRSRWSRSIGLCAGMFCLCALTAIIPASVAYSQTSDARPAVMSVAGPFVTKEMVEALVAEYVESNSNVKLEYLRRDLPVYAAKGLMSGADLALMLGRVTAKDLGRDKDRWKARAPEEHIIGARAVAIVVHSRNPVGSLTLDQLQVLFSGKAKDWSVFGGGAKSVRCYGLAFTDPLAVMFHEKVLAAAKCGTIVRKNDSAQIFAALSGDPEGVAFVDAIAAISAGDAVKMIAVGPASPAGSAAASAGKAAVSPNAQTIKDGTYPLSETLTLYVSPKASQAARDFADFVLTGGGDAVCRKYGFMPTLHAAGANVLDAFKKLYGKDIDRVMVTEDTADDLVLADQLIQSAGKIKQPSADLLTAMCETAYELAADVSGGETIALEALGVLWEKVPDRRFDCLIKRAAICRRMYRAGDIRDDGEHLTEMLMLAAEVGTESHRFTESADMWKRALIVAEEVNSPHLPEIKDRMEAFEARRKSQAEAASLAASLRSDSKNTESRANLFHLHLLELDNPAEAMKFLDAVSDEEYKTYVPLASEPMDKLSENTALNLAEWYVGLTDKAGIGGKELMSARARNYYARFFELHKDRQDDMAMRASLGIQKVGGEAPEPADESRPKPDRLAMLITINPGENVTDLRLAEFAAANPDADRLTCVEIGLAKHLTNLRPLERLPKLTVLELRQAGSIKDLSPLAKLKNLRAMTLVGLEIDDISALAGLSGLTNLEMTDANSVADITSLGRLLGLQTVNLSRCSKIENLSPLSSLTSLTELNLSDCKNVENITPLEKLSRKLTNLNLVGTKVNYVMPLSKLSNLKTLDLQRCEKITTGDVEWLTRHLPDCKIISDASLKKPEPKNSDKW